MTRCKDLLVSSWRSKCLLCLLKKKRPLIKSFNIGKRLLKIMEAALSRLTMLAHSRFWCQINQMRLIILISKLPSRHNSPANKVLEIISRKHLWVSYHYSEININKMKAKISEIKFIQVNKFNNQKSKKTAARWASYLRAMIKISEKLMKIETTMMKNLF